VAALQSRIIFHEDAIGTLLAHEPSSPEDPASLS
jgi:hypothetical protein